MKSKYTWLRRTAILPCLMALTFLSSCKKDKEEKGCPSLAPSGRLTYDEATKVYLYKTSGGGTISIAPASIRFGHDSYASFRIELWGTVKVDGVDHNSGNHENLNGKHIKDRFGSRRTIIFPDGAKATIVTDGEQGPIISISIYDGAEFHRLSGVCGTIEKNSTSLSEIQQLDNAEADGETGGFEFTSTGLLYVNFYTETTPGTKVMNRVLLGEIYRAQPQVVNDYFDDPRRADT